MTHRSSRRLTLLTAFSFAAAVGTGAVRAADFEHVVVFGDSLSDNGNLFAAIGSPPPPYWEGRFSNGPVWVERFPDAMGLPAEALDVRAMGGAHTADVLALQVVPWITEQGGVVPDDTLFVVWAGANDLLGLLEGGGDPPAVIGGAMSNLGQVAGALAAAGASELLLVSMPDFGLTPRVLATRDQFVIDGATDLAAAFNDALAVTAAVVQAETGLLVHTFDAFALLQTIATSPATFDLIVVDEPALTGSGVVADPDTYLFWDDIHPTRVAHAVLAHRALDQLELLRDGDVDADGAVGFIDLMQILARWGRCDGCFAELTGDGVVDVTDLLEVLANWDH